MKLAVMQNPSSHRAQAQIEEMKFLKSEIMFYNDLISKMEVAAIIAISGIYVWLFSNPEKIPNIVSASLISTLPIMLSLVVVIRYRSYQIRIARCAAYIRCVEEELGLFGYERFVWLTRGNPGLTHDKQELLNSITQDFQIPESGESSEKRENRYFSRAKGVGELPGVFSHFTKNTYKFWIVILIICCASSYTFIFEVFQTTLAKR